MQPSAPDPTSLDRLYDIVTPSPVPWWPPAPGWFVVGGAVIVGILWCSWAAWNYWRAAAYRRAALGELAEIQKDLNTKGSRAQSIQDVATLLKRTALAAFPRSEVAALSGSAWLRFLDESSGMTDFTQGVGQLLAELPYNPAAAAKVDSPAIHALFDVAARWIRRHSSSERLVTAPS